MSRSLTVAVIQCALGGSRPVNVNRVTSLIEAAAARGAQVILPPELFEGPYFPREQDERFFEWARSAASNATLEHFQKLADRLAVVIPYSFFEVSGPAYYNTICMIDADGTDLGAYRKSHIPDGPGYQEKFYFRPGDTGFKVWKTRHGCIGVGICWDQWFPECARAMALKGAEILLYPTAIGSEPVSHEDTVAPWQRAMIGHAVCNSMPIAAANRVGDEGGQVFYGNSFIADPRGDVVAQMGASDEGFVIHTFDLDALRARRGAWGFFRDRRPELYGGLLTADGKVPGLPPS